MQARVSHDLNGSDPYKQDLTNLFKVAASREKTWPNSSLPQQD